MLTPGWACDQPVERAPHLDPAQSAVRRTELLKKEAALLRRLKRVRLRRHWGLDKNKLLAAEASPNLICKLLPISLFGEMAVIDPWNGVRVRVWVCSPRPRGVCCYRCCY